MAKKERKAKRWYRPWRWFAGPDDRDGLYDISTTGDGGPPEHAAMEAALDIPAEDQARQGDGPIRAEVVIAGVPKSHIASQRVKARTVTPGVVVAAQIAAPAQQSEPIRGKASASRPLPPHAHLQVDERPATEVKDAWGLDKLSETIAAAATRDEVAREIVSYMAKHFRRAAAFSVRQDQASGWIGVGPGFFPERLAKTTIPLKKPSLFSGLASDPSAFIGPVADTHENTDLYAFLGGSIPPAVLVVPVLIRDRIVSILYADNDTDPLVWIDVAVWKRIAEMMALSFEIMILKNKMKG